MARTMMYQSGSGVILALTLLTIFTSGQESSMRDCDYAYLNQPPSEIPCNIYDDDNSSIIVHCDAVSLTSPNYTIAWYHEGERATNLTTGFIRHIFAQPGLQEMYFYFSRLLLTSEDELGRYYCQIEATDINDTDIDFEPGNAIYLRESEFYQNETSCNITQLTVSNGTCSRFEIFTIAPTVVDPIETENTTQKVNFPSWGYVIPILITASILVTAIVVFCACIKICQKSNENLKESYSDYELASVQGSSSISTDHTYEELDLHVPEVDSEQALQSHTHINRSAVEHEVSIPTRSSNHVPTCTPPAEIETVKTDKSKGYDKLLAVDFQPLHDTVVMKNEACVTYDQLDPKVEVNLLYNNRRDSCNPPIVANPSYRKTEAVVVMKNKAYNKRDELDPKTGACLAYICSL